jgi:putative FmdB family regulatory protein
VPTYDYRCKACGQELEVFQSFSDEPLTTCEACGGQLRKLFGAPGIAFKGSGFYKTDSRSGSSRSRTSTSTDKAGSEKTSTSSDSSSSSNGSEGVKKETAASSSSTSDSGT